MKLNSTNTRTLTRLTLNTTSRKTRIESNNVAPVNHNYFFVLKNFAFLRKYGYKRYYVNCSGPEVLVELSSLKENVKIRFLWSGNSGLQMHIIRPGLFKNKEINILDISHDESKKRKLIKLEDREDVNMVLEKYSSFFELEVVPYLKKRVGYKNNGKTRHYPDVVRFLNPDNNV